MKTLVLLLTLWIAAPIFAQSTIDEIDALVSNYDKRLTNAMLEEEEYLVPHLEVKSQIMKRAIGIVDHTITIYFDKNDKMMETKTHTKEVHHATIRKANFQLISGSYTIDYAYSYNEQGDLIYYEEKMIGYSCYTKKMYFLEGVCVRVSKKAIKTDACEPTDEKDYKRIALTKEDKEESDYVLKKAEQFKALLKVNYSILMD